MSSALSEELREFLTRSDGQEDICIATYAVSSGATRSTAVLDSIIYPDPGETSIHGNASLRGEYVLRAANIAADRGGGIALLHSHPRGKSWQGLSLADYETEQDFARVAQLATSFPLVGITLACEDGAWSARSWIDNEPEWHDAVRVVGPRLSLTWSPFHLTPTAASLAQSRSLAAWGRETQANVAKLKVLVVGVGSVGLRIAETLAASGVARVGVMDFDIVKEENRDRMIGVTANDVALRRSKTSVAGRLATQARTSTATEIVEHNMRLDTSNGLGAALDYDVIFSCVDRPLPRAVLNTLAYADLIPVVDGGIAIDRFDDGRMRAATWRAHVATPGRPCLICSRQLSAREVNNELAGVLDDPHYFVTGENEDGISPNVALLSAGVIGAMLAQFVSLVVAPGGEGVPFPQQFILPGHTQLHLECETDPDCVYERMTGVGDHRLQYVTPTVHPVAAETPQSTSLYRKLRKRAVELVAQRSR